MSLYKRRLGAGSAVALAAVIVAVLVFGVTALRAEANFIASTPPPLSVSTITAHYDDDASIAEFFPGLIAARRQSALGFERSGRIESILVDVGDRVVEGEMLARLDVRALQAQIAAADAQTAEAAAQTALASGTETRQAQLLERGHISQQRFDEVRTSTRAALARQNAAAAAADALRIQLDLSVMTAPFDGVVTARRSDEGAIASPGQPLLELVELDSLEVRVGLPQIVAARYQPGDTASFEVDSQAQPVRAHFRASSSVVDRQTRTVTAVFDLDPAQSVAAGQIVRLAVETPIGTEGFWVPTAALAEGRRGLWSVYVLAPDETGDYRLEPRVVETVRIEAERVYVRGAVADGELLLASGLQRITPGQHVVPATLEARAR
ncbi:efflux RND transporter periplasmic adaptor subunit [Maricaulis maris]|uniref:RND family efflux transporter MFP subunit n=1 Tax=Maricaulis maris TaxID=74318 RepID=A0A495DEQ5_9PROT|nr:efflux RND transporter periplasmic adaptor subunit [Maricaulis maris]RKR00026.1 RND family efflux transporter MFP subunit [Maricaulis maris]